MSDSQNEFYANAVNITGSLYDVTLTFRIQTPVVMDQSKAPIIQSSSECNIRMSPQHAKALAALLVDQVKQYEDRFKLELPLEDNIAPLWKAIKKG